MKVEACFSRGFKVHLNWLIPAIELEYYEFKSVEFKMAAALTGRK